MSSNPVVHFEMPAEDKKRVADFYTRAFGWNMQQFGEDMGNYLIAQTAETDEKGMVKVPGAVNGGFFDYKDETGMNIPHIVISVDDINKSIGDVKASGGTIAGDIMDIPGVGKYVSFKDTEDNIVGMLQPIQ